MVGENHLFIARQLISLHAKYMLPALQKEFVRSLFCELPLTRYGRNTDRNSLKILENRSGYIY